MKKTPFLVDTNVLITASKVTYPMDVFPSFWESLEKSILQKDIAILRIVKDEVSQKNDEVSTWLNSIQFTPIDNQKEEIFYNYVKVDNYAHEIRKYKPSELRKWFDSLDCSADPWLIATAMIEKNIIVTLEDFVPPESQKIKIPNIAKHFEVQCINPVEMMRLLNYTF